LFISESIVEKIIELKDHIYLLKIKSPEIAEKIKPGQFVNIKVCNSSTPLLRRPFSICDVEDSSIFIMFNIHGEGTKILAQKREGECLDVLGPLGNGFLSDDDFTTAIIVAGGMGVAPFPFFTKQIKSKKEIFSFIGGRSDKDIIKYGLKNPIIATEDGSEGIKGNVIDLLKENESLFKDKKIRFFGCGPTPMLRALKYYCIHSNFECEVSTECAMACGFGICQGCPIESTSISDSYLLVCKDGPVFNIKDVVL